MEKEKASSTEENKALVIQFFSAIENNKLDMFDELVARDYNDHLQGQTPGREVLKQYFAGLHIAFADLELPVLAMVAEGDKVAVHNSIKGIHRAEYSGLKAKGNPVNAQAFQLYRVEKGQLAEHWEVADLTTLLQQIQA
jgi:predicted SnoaL-like aldol condensation-catalyzing enzyme